MSFAKLSGGLLACKQPPPTPQTSLGTAFRRVDPDLFRPQHHVARSVSATRVQERLAVPASASHPSARAAAKPLDPALKHHLAVLKLPAFLREYDELARLCAAGGLSHADFLLHLAQLELGERERRLAERRIKEAQFPVVKSLDSFDFSAIPSLDKSVVVDLARCEYVEHNENIIVVGDSGTGKTHIGLALGLAACWKGLSVGFVDAAAIVHELLEMQAERRLSSLQRRLAGYRVLIVYDLGYVPLPPGGAELLFEVLSRRCERGSTIVTSNLPTTEWVSVFGSQRLAAALLDRLSHRLHVLEMRGESYRLRRGEDGHPDN